jgi:Flp pilus assembly protein TadD
MTGRWAGIMLAIWFGCLPAVADISIMDQPADQQVLEAEASAITRKLLAAPRDARLYTARGKAYFRLREFDKATADFTRAIELDSKQDDAWFGRGMARGRGGEIEKGIADLGVYIERHPDSTLAYTKRGIRNLWAGKLNAAEADFRKAIALNPRNAEAHDDLGVILAQRQDYAEAIKHFTLVISEEASYQKAHHNLAMALYITGDNQRALASVDNALRLAPESRDSMTLRALVLNALGRTAEAQKTLEDAEMLPVERGSEQMAIQ